MIMCVLLCYPVSIRIYYQQGILFLVFYLPFQNNKYFNYNDIITQLQKNKKPSEKEYFSNIVQTLQTQSY